MSVLVIAGTGTEVGKTVVTAAIAALAQADGRRVAVLKPAQTGTVPGEPGDLEVVRGLAGDVTVRELARYPDPLSPEAAARRGGLPTVSPAQIAAAAVDLDNRHDLVLIEGAGGLLVRFGPDGATLADVAWSIGSQVLVVAEAGLGVLNVAALTAEALRHRGLDCAGVVVGRWPSQPDLAARTNLEDLPVVAEAPLVGALPDGAGGLTPEEFRTIARESLAPQFGGHFDAARFVKSQSSP